MKYEYWRIQNLQRTAIAYNLMVHIYSSSLGKHRHQHVTAKEPFVMTIATHVPERDEPSLLSSQEWLESIRVLEILPQARGHVDTCGTWSAKWS